MNFAWLVDQLHKFLVGMLANPGMPGTTTMDLGTGVDVESERIAARERLKQECEAVVNDTALLSRDVTGDGIPETFCNIAVGRVAANLGCPDFPRDMSGDFPRANDMYGIMAAGGSGWRPDSAERAHMHAWRGGLAIAAHEYGGHGHVAVIYPEDHMTISGHWGQVPYVANVGKLNQVMPVSNAFPVHDTPPTYFLWQAGSI